MFEFSPLLEPCIFNNIEHDAICLSRSSFHPWIILTEKLFLIKKSTTFLLLSITIGFSHDIIPKSYNFN